MFLLCFAQNRLVGQTTNPITQTNGALYNDITFVNLAPAGTKIAGKYAFKLRKFPDTKISAKGNSSTGIDNHPYQGGFPNASYNTFTSTINDPTGDNFYTYYSKIGIIDGKWVDAKYSIIYFNPYINGGSTGTRGFIGMYNDLRNVTDNVSQGFLEPNVNVPRSMSLFGFIVEGSFNENASIKMRLTFYEHQGDNVISTVPISTAGTMTFLRLNSRKKLNLTKGVNFDKIYVPDSRTTILRYGNSSTVPATPGIPANSYVFTSNTLNENRDNYVGIVMTFPETNTYEYVVQKYQENSSTTFYRLPYDQKNILQAELPAPQVMGQTTDAPVLESGVNVYKMRYNIYQSIGSQGSVTYMPEIMNISTTVDSHFKNPAIEYIKDIDDNDISSQFTVVRTGNSFTITAKNSFLTNDANTTAYLNIGIVSDLDKTTNYPVLYNNTDKYLHVPVNATLNVKYKQDATTYAVNSNNTISRVKVLDCASDATVDTSVTNGDPKILITTLNRATNSTTVKNGTLVIESKNKGLALPNVTNTSSVASPKEGMMVYDVSTSCIKYYNGTSWSGCIKRVCKDPNLN